MDKFTNRLKELKEEKKYTQTYLAHKLNTTQQTIGRWIRGENEPDIYNLIRLANIFNCSVSYLVGEEGEDGVVVVSGNELSPDEEHLISILRQLNPRDKDAVYRIAELAYDVQKGEKNK